MNTELWYQYRDAANYKENEVIVLEGEMAFAEIAPYLDDGQFFIPEQVGLESLTQRMPGYPDEELDHPWHSIDSDDVTLTDETPNAPMTARELVAMFAAVKRWDGSRNSYA